MICDAACVTQTAWLADTLSEENTFTVDPPPHSHSQIRLGS